MSDSKQNETWGRVDEDNRVFVKDSGAERLVGQYPEASKEEALAYFVRKYDELASHVSSLELRVARSTAGGEALDAATRLREQLVAPNAVGDLESLRSRLAAVIEKLEALSEAQSEERAEAKAKALHARTEIVLEAEKLAGQDFAKANWKQTSAQMDALFSQWQSQQKAAPNIGKAQADELWKRFKKARQVVDSGRRKFFAELDANSKDVRAKKEKLIKDAEALAPRGSEGVPAYRELLNAWKEAGRANRKTDDQLWARFKAAGDVLYAAKAENDAKLDEEFGANLQLKLSLLDEYADILKTDDAHAASSRLQQLQKKWDAVGRVPRANLREVEDRIKKLEQHVRSLQDKHWKSTDPEKEARSSGLRKQLEESISALTAELAQAEAAGDSKQVEAIKKNLASQESWLQVIG